MSRDDQDTESSNPSKNFKVGDFDQLSGFFTPVWESKRKIRSEPPPMPSSRGGGSGGASRGSAASRPPSVRPAAPGTALGSAIAPPLGVGNGVDRHVGPAPRDASVPRPRGTTPERPRPNPVRGTPKARSAATGTAPPDARARVTAASPDVAAVFNSTSPAGVEPSVATLHRGEGAAERPPREPDATLAAAAVHPREQAAPRPTPALTRTASSAPSPALLALQNAGPALPPAAYLDAEPEFRPSLLDSIASARAPLAEARSGAPSAGLRQRALRAAAAATRLHGQLKAQYQAEAAEIDESRGELGPDTRRSPLEGLGFPAEPDPSTVALLRRLRRTIRLATPVPDPIRSLISKYDRS